MRITSIILSVIGALAAAFLAFKWLGDASDQRQTIEAARALGADLSQLDRIVMASYGLLGAAAAGLVSVYLLVKRKGPIAAAVLIVGVAIPAALAPKTLVFTFFLVIAAGFALAVRAPDQGRVARSGQGLVVS